MVAECLNEVPEDDPRAFKPDCLALKVENPTSSYPVGSANTLSLQPETLSINPFTGKVTGITTSPSQAISTFPEYLEFLSKQITSPGDSCVVAPSISQTPENEGNQSS